MNDEQEKKDRLNEKLKREFGKEIMAALNDPMVIEILLNDDGSLWIEKMGENMLYVGKPNINPKASIGTIASSLNTSITVDNPILECELPLDGSRFEALIPPIVANPSFAIRKKASQIFTLEEYLYATS